ncbi:MAG: chemotaxis protein, partial [Comamonadaceae bacterium CG_4_9_14_0_8_um_filter_60_18]
MPQIDNLIDIFLQPGELFVADAGFQIRTILGSCVS